MWNLKEEGPNESGIWRRGQNECEKLKGRQMSVENERWDKEIRKLVGGGWRIREKVAE